MVESVAARMPPEDPYDATGEADLPAPAFRPGDAESFRRAWRGIGSTVTLIATEHRAVRHAMLATAVSSVSMEPPSLLVCVNHSASSHAALCERGAFSLGIIGSSQRDLAAAIAEAPSAQRFTHGTWRRIRASGEAIDGLPWLEEARTTLFCAIDARLDYGTHSILVARIANATEAREADPLIYCDGSYGRFASPAA
ncbi:flavin oxidoreductase [Aureimonas endophytica]|uniref:Flavin oxidoreductase n=1 Tax=Aureimonas endophytica TaxID=2027858 RepID=A0A916ZP23_9HYPH|nr:flavin reductase family protein [Aureimonas endophytica]GGE05688.1 flavin oxidoreductase [Aureimonas endophytica]